MPYILFLQQLIASSTHLFAKSITNSIHPAHVVLFRGGFALCAYAVWMYLSSHSISKIEKKDWPAFFLLGALNIPINQLLFIWGIKYTTPANASLAYALSPAFVLIIAYFFLKEKITPLKVLGIVIALIGTIIVLFEKGFLFGSEQFLGNIMVLCASISWAIYTTLGKKYAMKYNGVFTTGISMLTGVILYIPIVLLMPFSFEISNYTSFNWLQLCYLGVITSGLGYGLLYYALSKMEASKLSVFNNIQPILTTIMAFFLFGQLPSSVFVIGAMIAIVGVILTQKG